jgi:hypothetical protein
MWNEMIINVLHLVVTWSTVLSCFGSFVGRGLSRLSARRGSHVVSCQAKGNSGVGCATRCAIRCAVYVTVVSVVSFLGNESDRNVFTSRRWYQCSLTHYYAININTLATSLHRTIREQWFSWVTFSARMLERSLKSLQITFTLFLIFVPLPMSHGKTKLSRNLDPKMY